jgi:radical SAM protein with 4Fe4S-binding SPASM domain
MTSLLSAPLRVTWDLTTRCNLSCRHCYNASHYKANTIPPHILHMVADKLASSGIFFITLSGGEPLMEPEIWNIITIFKEKKKNVTLVTNGTLITEKIARKIKGAGIDSVQISIDGLRETHDYLRRAKGCFDKSLHALEFLLNEKVFVTVNMTVSQRNVEEVPLLLNHLLTMGVHRFRATRLVTMGRSETSDIKTLTKEQTKSLTEYLLEKRLEYKDKIQIVPDECMSFLGEKIHDYGLTWSGCPAGITECAVDSAGIVYPCVFLSYEEFGMGSLLDSDFDEIWRSEPFQKFRKIERMCRCPIFDFCKGGCPAAAYGRYKDIKRKDPYCWRDEHELPVSTQ